MTTLLHALARATLSEVAGLIAGAAIFVILFTAVFSARVNVTLAMCVSLLAVIGVRQTFSQAGRGASASKGYGRLDCGSLTIR
jgi:hypothetical protein